MKIINGDVFQKEYKYKKKKNDLINIAAHIGIIFISIVSLIVKDISFTDIFLRIMISLYYISVINQIKNYQSMEFLFTTLLFIILLISPNTIINFIIFIIAFKTLFEAFNYYLLTKKISYLVIGIIITLIVVLIFKSFINLIDIIIPVILIAYSIYSLSLLLRGWLFK